MLQKSERPDNGTCLAEILSTTQQMKNVECQKDSVSDNDLESLTVAETVGMGMRHASDSALEEHQAMMSVPSSEEAVSLNVSATHASLNESFQVGMEERDPKKCPLFRHGVYRDDGYITGNIGVGEKTFAVHLGASTADRQAHTVE